MVNVAAIARLFQRGASKFGNAPKVKPPKTPKTPKASKLTKTKLGAAGAGGFLADMAIDAISNLLSKSGKGNTNNFISKRIKDSKRVEHPQKISHNITIKKHDYPNTYRVQLNQLSNSINYAIKQDKISNRKTNTKYQSILCKKILKKITLHTDVQNDLIVNEVYNVINSNSNISEKTKKAFIENILEQVRPKTKDGFSEAFVNRDTLRELKHINQTQVKIYGALKQLSYLTVKNAREKSRQVQRTTVKPVRSGGYSISGSSGNSGSMLNGLLGALAGGALASLFAGFTGFTGGSKDSEGSEKSDGSQHDSNPVTAAIAIGSNVAQTAMAGKNRTALKTATSKPTMPSVTEGSTSAKTHTHTTDASTKVSTDTGKNAEKAEAKPNKTEKTGKPEKPTEFNSDTIEKAKQTVNKNKKEIKLFKKILGKSAVQVAIKVLSITKGIGLGALTFGLQAILVEYQLQHLDDMLGRKTDDADKAAVIAIAGIENIPVAGSIIALLDLAPTLMNFAGFLINEFICPVLENLIDMYKKHDQFIQTIIKDFPIAEKVFELGALSLPFLLDFLRTVGGTLQYVDPDLLVNCISDASRAVTKAMEAVYVAKSAEIEYLEDQGYLESSGIITNGVGTSKITDFDRIRKELTTQQIEALINYKGLNENDKYTLRKIQQEQTQSQYQKTKSMSAKEADIYTSQEINKTTFESLYPSFVSDGMPSWFMDYDIEKVYKAWMDMWKEFKAMHNTNYLYCPPKRVQFMWGGKIFPKGTYYIFLFGTVATVVDPSKRELRNENIRLFCGLQQGSEGVKYITRPYANDKEAYEMYFSKPQHIKNKESQGIVVDLPNEYVESPSDKLIRNAFEKYQDWYESKHHNDERKGDKPNEVDATKDANVPVNLETPAPSTPPASPAPTTQGASAIPTGIAGAAAFAASPGTSGNTKDSGTVVTGNAGANAANATNAVNTTGSAGGQSAQNTLKPQDAPKGSGLAYLLSKLNPFGFDVLFIMQNEMDPFLYKELINGNLHENEEMPLTIDKPGINFKTDFMGNCSRGRYFYTKKEFMPHYMDPKNKYKYKCGGLNTNKTYTYFDQSVRCCVAWFKENLNAVKKHINFDKLNLGFKTVIADITYHVGGYIFGTNDDYAKLCQALNSGDLLTAKKLIETVIDQKDGGKPITQRVKRRVQLLNKYLSQSNSRNNGAETSVPAPSPAPAISAGANAASASSTDINTGGSDLPANSGADIPTPVPVSEGNSAYNVPGIPAVAVPATEPPLEIPTAPANATDSASPAPVTGGNAYNVPGMPAVAVPADQQKPKEDRSKIFTAVKLATRHARGHSIGYCARYVANALQGAGFKFTRQRSAYMYHTNGILAGMGFSVVHSGLDGFTPQVGDICVIDKFNKHRHGHICIWNGKNWISDFRQKNASPYYDKPHRVWYYRYKADSADISQDVDFDFDSMPYTGDADSRALGFSGTMNAYSTAGTQSRNVQNAQRNNVQPLSNENQVKMLSGMKTHNDFSLMGNKYLTNANAFFTFPVFGIPLGAVT